VNIQKKKSPAEPEAMIEVSEATEIPPGAYICGSFSTMYLGGKGGMFPLPTEACEVDSGPVLEV